MRRKWSRNRFWQVVLASGTAVVVVLLVLVGVGVLRPLAGPGPGTLTVSIVHWEILEGQVGPNSSQGWFGPSQLNYTQGEGYPTSVTAGATFTISLILAVFGGENHTVFWVATQAPFTVVSCDPVLPITVSYVQDSATFFITVLAPSLSGQSLPLNMTLDSLDSFQPPPGACG